MVGAIGRYISSYVGDHDLMSMDVFQQLNDQAEKQAERQAEIKGLSVIPSG